MREAGITVRHRKKYKVTTNSNHQQPLFENVLDRQFSVSGPENSLGYHLSVDPGGWLYRRWSSTFFPAGGGLEYEFTHEGEPGD